MTDLPASIVLDGSDIFVEFKGAMAEQYAMQQLKSDTDLHEKYILLLSESYKPQTSCRVRKSGRRFFTTKNTLSKSLPYRATFHFD